MEMAITLYGRFLCIAFEDFLARDFVLQPHSKQSTGSKQKHIIQGLLELIIEKTK